jgi:phosphatidylinositol glycan class S
VSEKGERLSSNGFLIPRWGGVVIANPESDHLSTTELKPFMQLYLAQLRDLLGIRKNWNRDFKLNYRVVNEWSKTGIKELEYDMLVRGLIGSNLENAGKTLASLMYVIDLNKKNLD